MSADTWWLALALVLVIEGLLPMLAPAAWRRMFAQLLQFNDGQLRFYGACSILAGLAWVWWLRA